MPKKPKKPCAGCGRGFPEECTRKKPCDVEAYLVFVKSAGFLRAESSMDEGQPVANKKKGGTYETLSDPHSTGRKRAAQLYPLDKEAPCEWLGKKNCGGGRVPITGCTHGKQTARHHGPIKNTTRNQLGNVHRICTRCHNHWHELNDLIYDEREYSMLPHDPVEATAEELVADEMLWVTGKISEKYKLASSENKNKKLEVVD